MYQTASLPHKMDKSQLLSLLSKSTKSCHISEFRGQTVAVDSYYWLHDGAKRCAMKLAQGTETTLYMDYCMDLIWMLQNYGIKPIMVFDGIQNGKSERTVDSVTHKMTLNLIKKCRKAGVDCIVAPYEATAQLAFLTLNKIVNFVITEDTNVLLFSCDKVLFKMNLQGDAVLLESDKIYLSLEIELEKYTFEKFRLMCILAGCDYLDPLPGIGLKEALNFVKSTSETNPLVFLDKVPSYLNIPLFTITPAYKEQFLKAEATLKYQIVFNPFLKQSVHLNNLTDKNDLKYFRIFFNQNQSYQLALGNLDPETMDIVDNWNPSTNNLPLDSIWSGDAPQTHPMKSVNCKTDDLETSQEIKDDQLQDEKTPSPFTSTDEVPKKSDDGCSGSPVLTSYPFLKKKISQFPTTNNSVNKSFSPTIYISSDSSDTNDNSIESEDSDTNENSIDSEDSDTTDNLTESEDSDVIIIEEKEDEKNKKLKHRSRDKSISSMKSSNYEGFIEEIDGTLLDKLVDDMLEQEPDCWVVDEVLKKEREIRKRKADHENLENVPNQRVQKKSN